MPQHRPIESTSNRHSPILLPENVTDHSTEAIRTSITATGMSQLEIRSALDTSVVMRLLTGQPLDLATAAQNYMGGPHLLKAP